MTTTPDAQDPTTQALRERIQAYRDATREFVEVASALTAEDLDRQPADPHGWTPRMVVHHMADAEANAYVRLRRLLAEPAGMPIHGYDEELWASKLRYDRPVESSRAVVAAVRDSSAEMLDLLTPRDLSRTGVHSDSGSYALADWLDIYTAHAADHADQIRVALA